MEKTKGHKDTHSMDQSMIDTKRKSKRKIRKSLTVSKKPVINFISLII